MGEGVVTDLQEKGKSWVTGKKGDDSKLKFLVCGENVWLGCRGCCSLQDGWGGGGRLALTGEVHSSSSKLTILIGSLEDLSFGFSF
jgi:hypothetical protein